MVRRKLRENEVANDNLDNTTVPFMVHLARTLKTVKDRKEDYWTKIQDIVESDNFAVSVSLPQVVLDQIDAMNKPRR